MLLKWIRRVISCLPNWVWSIPEVVPLSSVHIYLWGRGVGDKGGNFILFSVASSLFIDLSFSLQFFVQRVSEVRAAGNLHSFISMYFFQAVLNIFPIVLTRRIGLTIKCIFSWLSFPLSSCP